MGKQAKKKQKSEAQAAGQKTHNRATRGINTKRKGALWARRFVKSKDEEGNEVELPYDIFVPPRTMWDPWDRSRNDERRTDEPFDSLHLDWREEMMHYAAEINAHIGRLPLGDGVFLYRVYYGNNPREPKEVLFEVESSRSFTLERSPRRKPKAG